MNKTVRLIAISIMLIFAIAATALAAPLIDGSRTTGSLYLEKYAGTSTRTPLAGVVFSAYRLAEYDFDAGKMVVTSTFSGSGYIETTGDGDIDTDALASRLNALRSYINNNDISATYTAAATNRYGAASFDSMTLGIYLILETRAPSNVTSRSANFFVSIPMTSEDGEDWIYDIEAYPKNAVTTTTTTPPTRTPTPSPTPTRVTQPPTTTTTTTPPSYTDIGDSDTPLGTTGFPETDIFDVDVPLAETFDLPKTGGGLAVELLTIGGPVLMLLGLFSSLLLGTKRRKLIRENP